MRRVTLREWEEIEVGDSSVSTTLSKWLTNIEAEELMRVAASAARQLRLGNEDGSSILSRTYRKLEAGQVVGVISTPQISLEILPKIDGADEGKTRLNLVHMLARVFDLRISDGAVTQLGWQRLDLLEIIIKLFCDKLFEVVHRGVPRRYVNLEDDLKSLRGRLNIKRQFTSLAVSPQYLSCRYEELSVDISLNQVMKTAVRTLRGITRNGINQRRLYELGLAFIDVSDIPADRLKWDDVVIDRTNAQWRELLTLAQVLLGRRFQNTTLGRQSGFSLLFEMNTLFEEFIGKSVQRALLGAGAQVQLQGPRNYVLLDANGTQRFATRPDIYICFSDGQRIIVDTKWKQLSDRVSDPKQGISQGDVYQMLAYGQVYKCTRLMLLYPHHSGLGTGPGLISEFSVNSSDRSRLEIATIDISSPSSVEGKLRMLLADKNSMDVSLMRSNKTLDGAVL